MKRAMMLLVVLVFVAGTLPGCLGMSYLLRDEKDLHTQASSISKVTDSPVDPEDEVSEEETSSQEIEGSKEEKVEEYVIYDENEIKITVRSIETDIFGKDLKLLVENGSEKNIAFVATEFVVNGVSVGSYTHIDVAAGKKANGSIYFSFEDLEEAGIEMIASVEGKDARITDTDRLDTLYDIPFCVVTDVGEDHIQIIDDTGDILFQKSGLTVVSRALEDDMWGYSVKLVVKNETGTDVTISADNISVNGYTVDGWLYDDVYANTVRFCEISLSSVSLEENDIDTIEEITFTLEFYDPDTYETIMMSDELQVFVAE